MVVTTGICARAPNKNKGYILIGKVPGPSPFRCFDFRVLKVLPSFASSLAHLYQNSGPIFRSMPVPPQSKIAWASESLCLCFELKSVSTDRIQVALTVCHFVVMISTVYRILYRYRMYHWHRLPLSVFIVSIWTFTMSVVGHNRLSPEPWNGSSVLQLFTMRQIYVKLLCAFPVWPRTNNITGDDLFAFVRLDCHPDNFLLHGS